MKGDFNSEYNVYKVRLLKKQEELFHIFFKLNFDKAGNIPLLPNLKLQISDELISTKAKDTNKAFFEKNDKTRFLHFTENALDANTALMQAKLKLSTFLDKIHKLLDRIRIYFFFPGERHVNIYPH